MGDNVETATGTQVPLSAADSGSKEVFNTSHPCFISSSDSPGALLVNTVFDGKSFGGWKRAMWIALTAKNKAGFIDGSTPEPEIGTDLCNAWGRANNMVISWILNSLYRDISESVLYYANAKDIWEELEARFGQSSGARLYQLQKELSDLVQGPTDIATYFTKIKRLWDELDTLDSFIPCSCICSCKAKEKNIKSKQDERLVKFLMGLNDSYCGARGNILMISPLPTISNAYALSQKGYYDNKKSGSICKYCKKPGHSIEKCYKLHEFPPNFKFTKQRNFQNSVQGNAVSSNKNTGEVFMSNAGT
ncbi:uncharacterized protein LOC132637964 [Lycium barbarum]|uniref:uncharacterized protein LOC132637964 n=1 Tax=Lycium barbarum TaxID=112863 RepID=UPI00293ED879|nr:uncharacterized protein LOC132637964 [Lycium barbarum]